MVGRMSSSTAALLPEIRRALVHRPATGQVEGRTPSVVAAVVQLWSTAADLATFAAFDGWEGLTGYFAGERLQVRRNAAGVVSHLDLGTFVFTRQSYDPAAPVPGGVDPAGWRAAGG